jgi:hypothetical protein
MAGKITPPGARIAAPCCSDCEKKEKFGADCFYFWENKKQCSMRASDWDDANVQQ